MLQSHLNRATEIHNLNSIIAGIAIAVTCTTFSIGMYQKDAILRQVCGATSFVSSVAAAISRKAVRINQNYLQKSTALIEENETDSIFQETRPMRNLNISEPRNDLRSANSPFENEIYLGW